MNIDSVLTSVTLPEMTQAGLHEALCEKLPELSKNAPIMDLGCGSGAWLERLHGLGFHNLHGVDAVIPAHSLASVNVQRCDIAFDVLPFASNSLEFVSAIEVIEHIENIGHVFSEISRVLIPGGMLLLTTPNVESLLCRTRFLLRGKLRQFDEKGDPTHIIPILSDSLKKIAARHSLEIVSQWCYPENGMSATSRAMLRLGTSILGLVLPDKRPGDIACYFLKRK